jgi:hypothetical protein
MHIHTHTHTHTLSLSLSLSLSKGWEMKYDPSSGAPLYINHATKTTQWEPPTNPPAAAAIAAPQSGSGEGGGRAGAEDVALQEAIAASLRHGAQEPQGEGAGGIDGDRDLEAAQIRLTYTTYPL